jgi:hypothetical protein
MFYEKDTLEKFEREYPYEYSQLRKIEPDSNNPLKLRDNNRILYWKKPNSLIMAVATRDNDWLCRELESNRIDDAIGQAKQLAVETRNISALRIITKYQDAQELNPMYKTTNLNVNLLRCANDKDDRMFKMLVEESSLETLNGKIFDCHPDASIKNELILANIIGKCTQENLDFYKKQYEKKHNEYLSRKQENMHCTIL